ncbi:hypothetical protein [Geobacter sp. SVR]|uniref:hypothetical protein n=1 Tax=Geobacter sp. SVR TaxID=2495594 RepID=UPI001563848D|nr:hypothetical protein [Geobacter sp. SVR]
MELREWEIWHTYSSTLRAREIHLESLAEMLVHEGVAQTVLHRDGLTFWRGNERVGRGTTDVNINSTGVMAEIKFQPENDQQPELSGFAREAWYQASHFRFNEKRIFHPDSDLPPPYVRVYLGQCNLVNEEEDTCIRIYPVVVIYETGVILVEFRTISPDRAIEVSDFISGAINLFQYGFQRIECSPGLVRLASRVWYHSHPRWRLYHRATLLFLERGHDIAVKHNSRIDDEGDFEFELAPLPNAGEEERLDSFALTIMHVIAYLAIMPRKGFSFLFRGQKALPGIGDYWVGRPHIYLIDFEGQKETSEENLKAHHKVFASILARIEFQDHEIPDHLMPEDSRIFSDYNAFINKEASLWVWSLSGKRRQGQWADQNRGHLIYERQATMELLEYGYMLHHRVLEKAMELSRSMDVLDAREDLLALDARIDRISAFGEIRQLLSTGWSRFGVKGIRRQINEALAVRGQKAATKEQVIAQALTTRLAIVFGLVAVPALASQVLEPLWGWLDLPRPADKSAFMTMLNLLALTGVGAIVSVSFRRRSFN